MESYGQGFLLQSLLVLEGLVDVVPNFYGLILGAGHDELLSDTSIHACDFIGMELRMDVVELRNLVRTFVKWDVNFQKLILRCDAVKVILTLRQAKRHEVGVLALSWVTD